MSEKASISPHEYTPRHVSGTIDTRPQTYSARHGEDTDPNDRSTRSTIMGAVQDFAHRGQTVDDAHTEAIKMDLALRKEADYDNYIDHLQEMSDQEKAGEIDGNLYSQRLRLENLRSDAEAYLEDKKDSVKAIGAVALNAIRGIKTMSGQAVNKKILEYKYNRAYKKHQKQRKREQAEKQMIAAKLERKNRKEAKKATSNSLLSRFGRRSLAFADRAYMTGLEQSDPAKAAEVKEQRKHAKKMALMRLVDPDIQLEATKSLFANPKFQPYERFDGDISGYLSEPFSNPDMPDLQFSILYEDNGNGMLQPQILSKQENDSSWKRSANLLPKNYPNRDHVTPQMNQVANTILREASGSTDNHIDTESLQSIATMLDYRPAKEKLQEAHNRFIQREQDLNRKIREQTLVISGLRLNYANKNKGQTDQVAAQRRKRSEMRKLAALNQELQEEINRYARTKENLAPIVSKPTYASKQAA